jgi:monoamine oxidase
VVQTLSDGRYQLGFAPGAQERLATVEHVVMAVPFTLLRQVDLRLELPEKKRQAINELGYGVNTKLCCETNFSVWRAQGSNGIVYTDRAFQSSWDATRLQPDAKGVLTSFTGGKNALEMAQGEIAPHAKHFLSDFDRVIPGTSTQATGRMVRIGWHQMPLAKGSYAAYLPGQYSTIAGNEGPRVGNLRFCGEHTSLLFQGYMEGAAATGMAVANEVGNALEGRAAAHRHLLPA